MFSVLHLRRYSDYFLEDIDRRYFLEDTFKLHFLIRKKMKLWMLPNPNVMCEF